MAIRITRNDAGNCINFVGSSNPAYWNACLSAVINSEDGDRVDIINDIRSENDSEIQYEFYAVDYNDFADKDNNTFTNAQAMVDYINENANVVGVSGVGADLTDTVVNFRLDQTSTSIIMDNGSSFGVNTIKAVADADGTIHIHAIGAGVPSGTEAENDHKHFEQLNHTNVQINGTAVAGGLQDVVNTLNELFTVGPFEAVVISDPYATMVADVGGVAAGYTLEGVDAVDPVGDDIFTFNGSGYREYAGLKSVATINQAGEYFTFDIRGEGALGFGLVHTQDSYDAGLFTGNSNYANPTTFATAASAHYGFQFSHWFHPTPNGSWTNYGASTGVVYGPNWYSWDKQADWLAGTPVKIKCGIDENGYIAIYTLNADNTWGLHARSKYVVNDGAEFHLGVKSHYASARVHTAPKVHLLEEEAPTMYFRYIESPDGNFIFPLFATEEEANYYNEVKGGTGTSHSHTYADDPTNTTWYMPDTYNGMPGYHTNPNDANTEATNAFNGNEITWTEITSLTNADLAPSQFTGSDFTYEEGTSVNLQLYPQGATWTQTVAVSPSGSGLVYDSTSGLLQGTLSDVASDTVYTVSVTRANSYGSNTGTFTITAEDVAPAVPVTGFTQVAGTDPLVDSDTLASGSAVSVDDVVANGYRFKITDSYVTNNILPALNATEDKVFIGFASNLASGWGQVGGGDFNCGFRFQYIAANTVRISAVLAGSSVGALVNHTYSGNIGLDFYLSNRDGVLEANYHPSSTNKETELTAEDGGTWQYSETNNTGTTQARVVVIAADGPSATDFETTGLSEHVIPAAPATNATSWTKALDFSGGNEYLKQVSNASFSNALRLDHQGLTIAAPASSTDTSADYHAKPWATAIVFKYDGNSSNQHIWNQGEGAGSTDDNIYLRLDSLGYLHFGWGRSGAMNECKFLYLGTSTNTNHWHGIYIAHNGTRLSGANATAANLAAAFDIRWFSTNFTGGVFGSWMDNKSTEANWNAGQTGGRMDRVIDGDFTIAGRGGNRNFHGKVASMVVTTLKKDVSMPSDAEIEKMVTDPTGWLTDYKVGNDYRYNVSNSTNFQNGVLQPSLATQVWLMGDGTSDSYANGMRNQVYPADQNYGKMQLNSMVSNDIETVSISGLS